MKSASLLFSSNLAQQSKIFRYFFVLLGVKDPLSELSQRLECFGIFEFGDLLEFVDADRYVAAEKVDTGR